MNHADAAQRFKNDPVFKADPPRSDHTIGKIVATIPKGRVKPPHVPKNWVTIQGATGELR